MHFLVIPRTPATHHHPLRSGGTGPTLSGSRLAAIGIPEADYSSARDRREVEKPHDAERAAERVYDLRDRTYLLRDSAIQAMQEIGNFSRHGRSGPRSLCRWRGLEPNGEGLPAAGTRTSTF